MLRVFHFILDHRIGGPHIYVRSLSRVLGPYVRSTLVTTGQGEVTELALTNLRHRLRVLYPIEVAWNVFRLCWLFRNKHSRICCIFDVHGAANIAPVWAARLLGVPVVWHFHETLGSFGWLVRLGKAMLPGLAHKFVIVAKKAAEVFCINDAELIPGSIDANFWRVTESDRQSREQGGSLRLVAVGNLNPLKGIDLLLDALGALNPPWELFIVGSELSTFREYAAMLHEKSRALAGSGGKVQFVGWQSPESVRRLLASAHVFVLPSRSEACPIALLEAMAMECVCVATDVGDVRDIINGPGQGIVTGSDSPAQLLMALEQVCNLGSVGRREMGIRARERVIVEFSQDMMAKRHLEVYRKLIQE